MILCDASDAREWVRHLNAEGMSYEAIAEAAGVSRRYVITLGAGEVKTTSTSRAEKVLAVEAPPVKPQRSRAKACIAVLEAYGFTRQEISQEVLGRARDGVADITHSDTESIPWTTLAILELEAARVLNEATEDYVMGER